MTLVRGRDRTTLACRLRPRPSGYERADPKHDRAPEREYPASGGSSATTKHDEDRGFGRYETHGGTIGGGILPGVVR
jgi:hypothetical protein